MKPVMEKLSTNYKDKLEVLFIDIRYDKESPRRFGVTVFPTAYFKHLLTNPSNRINI
jgi:hypothetical protein